MINHPLESPIVIFNVNDLGINTKSFLDETARNYNDLPWDYYDLRKMQLDFIRKHASVEYLEQIDEAIFVQYYRGEVSIDALQHILQSLTASQQELFNKIKPYRKRSMAEFLLSYDDEWTVKRIPIKPFAQSDALIDSDKKIDYRIFPRVFTESSDEAVENENFIKLLKGIAATLRASHQQKISKLNIVAHHTYVQATQEQVGDNSPEGIHQDGYDFIVSALVIERANISGAISQIFGADKKTRLVSTVLAPGQGILQPDRGTCLWHNVTPFAVDKDHAIGHRSSIGFDINIIQ